MPTRLTLTRHGETDWNVQRIWQGWSDIPLNENGRAQAAQLAEQLRDMNITRIISSPLSRAHATATIVGTALGLPVEIDERLKEIHVGDWSGLNIDQIRAQYPELYTSLYDSGEMEVPFPNGENRRDLHLRTEAALREFAERWPDEHILVVTHGGNIRGALVQFASPHTDAAIHNCSLHHLSCAGDLWQFLETHIHENASSKTENAR
jgi:broad specificity phosphatase PhoE